jgi:hypothetical protein
MKKNEKNVTIKNYNKFVLSILMGIFGFFIITLIVSLLFGIVVQVFWDPLMVYNYHLSEVLSSLREVRFSLCRRDMNHLPPA